MDTKGKRELIAELRQALEHNELLLYYQPQYNLSNSQFEGVEALIRWRHAKRGLLLPDEFIHIAEKTNLILNIGEWVLRTACRQNKVWQSKGLKPIRIAVNVSGRQIRQRNFVQQVALILKEFELAAHYLELEIKENIILHKDNHQIKAAIEELHQMGVLIALDDFGTGFSSLSHLKQFPVDRIKIDKTFIDEITNSRTDSAIVSGIISMASHLGVQVLAEGVESLLQLQTLTSQEKIEVQGFYFSEALSPEEVEKFLILYQNTPSS